MISISSHVQSWLDRNPFVYEQLGSGIINHSALARTIKSDIESQLGEKVSVESVTIALNRAGKAAKKRQTEDPLSFIGDVSVQTGLDILIYTVESYDTLQQPGSHTLKHGYYVATRGIWHASIITTSEITEQHALNSKAYEHAKNISATTIRLKPGHIPIPGVCAGILSMLAHKGVNFEEVISTHNELTIFTDQPNAERAMKALMDVKNR